MADLNTQVYNAQHPLVSVVMPAYNAEAFIAQSIESVISQTFTNWELLVVDDGSVDNTKTIVQHYCSVDARIYYYYQPNGKAGKARNTALKQARGEYIAFLDADDVWLEKKLAIQLSEIKEKNVDLVFSDAHLFSDQLHPNALLMHSGKGLYAGEAGLHSFLQKNQIPTLTVLVKKKCIDDAMGFTESPKITQAEDYHLWLKLLMNNCTFFGSPMVLAAYRQHATATTKADNLASFYVIEALEDLKQYYKQYSDLINQYQKQWFERCYYTSLNKQEYKIFVKKNCSYLNKQRYFFMISFINNLFGARLTRKVITRLINNHKQLNVFKKMYVSPCL